MEDVIVFDLSSLGYGPFFQQQIESSKLGDMMPARIAAEHRGAYEVWSSSGIGRAKLRGRLRDDGEVAGAPAVGDWVIVDQAPGAERTVAICRVLARRTVLSRGAAGRETSEQIVAANLDLVFVVSGLDADFNPRRVERYLARIWAGGAQPVVVLNKADLCADLAQHMARMQKHCEGVPVVATSALPSSCEAEGSTGAVGIEPLRTYIRPGMTVALVGSSGAGKSTIVNALVGQAQMRTAEVRVSDSRGRHTTTHRQLVQLPDGGLLIDTPGMRELQLVDDEGLGSVFADIEELGARCRFRDCKHETEPGCAVREALETGQLERERAEHYRKLAREARANELRYDARKRRQAQRVWGQLSDEVALLRKWKGGKP